MNRQAPSKLLRTPDGRMARLRPVRLFRLGHPRVQPQVRIQPLPEPETAESTQPKLQPIPSGQFYRVVSPVEDSMVTPQLGNELGKALEQFAQSNGFSSEQ